MYQNILVPTDGHEAAERAAQHGIAIADRFGATLHVVSVIVEPEFGAQQSDQLRTDPEEQAEESIERIQQQAKREEVSTHGEIVHGMPDEAIIRYAEEADVDLIVMGTHGRTGLDRILNRSITEDVIKTSSIPVLTVKMSDET